MKHFFYIAFVFLLFVGCSQNTIELNSYPQAADVPSVIELKGHTDSVVHASFSSDGKKVVTSSLDNTARIWDAGSGKELQLLEGQHSSCFIFAAFSADGKKAVTITDCGWYVQIWDVDSGKELQQLESPEAFFAAFSPDGKKIAAQNSGVFTGIWDADSGKQLQRLEGHAFSYRDRSNNVYPDYAYPPTLSPDGKWVITNGQNAVVVSDDSREPELIGHTGFISSATFSRDGKRIVTASADGTARTWDTESGKELQTLEEHEDSVSFAVFSPDGKKVVTTSYDHTARIWTLE